MKEHLLLMPPYELFIPKEQIQTRVEKLGAQISKDFSGIYPVVIYIKEGATDFKTDLTRHFTFPYDLDFMKVGRYGTRQKTNEEPVIFRDIQTSIFHRHVLVIEDIVDEGWTMKKILTHLQKRDPESIKVCTLLSKPSRRKVEVPIDYLGFKIPNRFVFGYGLDLSETLRWLTSIYYVNYLKKPSSA